MSKPQSKMRKLFSSPWTYALLGFVFLLVVIPLLLSPAFKWYLNRELGKLKDHRGHIENVAIYLFKGKASLYKVSLIQKWEPKDVPVFSSERIDTEIQWKALFKGKIVAESTIIKPVITYIDGVTDEPFKGKQKLEERKEEVKNWRDIIKTLIPIEITRIIVEEGQCTFYVSAGNELVDFVVKAINVKVEGLTNKPTKDEYMGWARATAEVPGKGEVLVNAKFDPIRKPLAFDVDMKIEAVNLVAYNKLFQKFAKFDLERGQFDFAAEAAVQNNYVKGYVKPLFSHIDVVGKGDKKDSPFRILWESIIGATAQILKNKDKDRLGAKIPFEGKVTNPNVDLWGGVISVLYNMLTRALTPSVENTVNLIKG